MSNEVGLNDPQAAQRFYDLVWPHRAVVLRVARLLTGNEADADDLAQDAMLKAYGAIQRFKDGTNVRAWLMTILRNARTDRLRAAAARSKDVSLHELAGELSDGASGDAGERSADWERPEEMLNVFSDQEVIDALQRLPEDIRWTLLLVDVEGIDHHEAAEVLRVPVGTIKSRIHRGRGMLRTALLPLARDRRLVRD